MRFRDLMIRGVVPALALAVISIHTARAGYIVTFQQSGSDVVATGSGSIDTAGLSDFSSHFLQPTIISSISAEFIGGQSAGGDWSGITGPAAFTNLSSGPGMSANAASGDGVGIIASGGNPAEFLLLPDNYTSDAPLSDTATWSNRTLADLDLLPGTYVWSWGSGPDADTFTVQIGAPALVGVPEPATLGLFAAALGALGIFRSRGQAGTSRELA
jgi:PEP-CTERM motif